MSPKQVLTKYIDENWNTEPIQQQIKKLPIFLRAFATKTMIVTAINRTSDEKLAEMMTMIMAQLNMSDEDVQVMLGQSSEQGIITEEERTQLLALMPGNAA